MIQLIGLKDNVSVEIREKFVVLQKRYVDYTKKLLQTCDEAVIISTCNRTEIYFTSACEDEGIVKDVFKMLHWEEGLIQHTFHYKGEVVVKHLLDVVCGFHSLILGEDQILGQVKEAYEAAQEAKTINKDLQRLFQVAVTCGKEFRAKANLYRIPVSSSSIAVNEARRRNIRGFMVIGYGEVGSLTVKYILSSAFECLYIVVRNPALLKIDDSRIKVIAFEEMQTYFSEVQCIISCTSAPHTVIRKPILPVDKPLLIFDLAVPRDVEEDVYSMQSVEVYNIDKVSAIDDQNKKLRKDIMEKNRVIVNKYIKEFLDWQTLQAISPEIIKLKNYGEKVYKERFETFKHKKNSKDNERLAEVLLRSTSNAFINRAIDVLKEEQLKGSGEECMRIIKKIFQID